MAVEIPHVGVEPLTEPDSLEESHAAEEQYQIEQAQGEETDERRLVPRISFGVKHGIVADDDDRQVADEAEQVMRVHGLTIDPEQRRIASEFHSPVAQQIAEPDGDAVDQRDQQVEQAEDGEQAHFVDQPEDSDDRRADDGEPVLELRDLRRKCQRTALKCQGGKSPEPIVPGSRVHGTSVVDGLGGAERRDSR